jgi:cytochrome c-type biogenesis protein CcmE
MNLTKLLRLLELTILAVSIVIISSTLIYFIMPKVLDVHHIVEQPELFKGSIGIVGRVHKRLIEKAEAASFLMVECDDDACAAIPVFYEGQEPAAGSKIIAYGKIEADEGGSRFIKTFHAYKVNARNSDSKGMMFYSISKAVQKWIIEKRLIKEFREWLYSKCKYCPKFKKWLIATPLFP